MIIHTPDVDFNAETSGADPRAVFVHGLGGDLHTWDGVWNGVTQEISALRYDLRGCGLSMCRRLAPFKHADDLLQVLDTSAIGRCNLIGVSKGASIALNFTLDHPERVSNLVLISPHLMAWEWSDDWMTLMRPIIHHARSGALDDARRLWWEHPLFATTRNSVAGPALFDSIMKMSADQWTDEYHELMLPDVERLHLLTTRTLLMTGSADLDEFRLIAELIESSASDLQRIDHAGLGHLLHIEDAAACANEILSFLK
jgi:pimeloyl-ACP methyl ester carboxylesterase